MPSTPDESMAVKLTTLFMRCSGIWAEDTPLGRRIMDLIVTYSIGALVFAFAITMNDLYHSYGDFREMAYSALNVSIVGMGLFKQVLFSFQRQTFLDVIIHAKTHFWCCSYDEYGSKIMRQCCARSGALIVTVMVLCHSTLIFYYIKPLIGN